MRHDRTATLSLPADFARANDAAFMAGRLVVKVLFVAVTLSFAPACLVVEASGDQGRGQTSGFTGLGVKVTCVAHSACDGERWTAEIDACIPDAFTAEYAQAECDAFVRDACPSRRDEHGVICEVDCAAVEGLCRVEELDFAPMLDGEQGGN